MQQRLPVFVSGERVGSEETLPPSWQHAQARPSFAPLATAMTGGRFPRHVRYDTLMICTGHFYIPTYNPMRFSVKLSAQTGSVRFRASAFFRLAAW